MLEIPRRISLSSQIANSIRKGIEDGLWEEYLPGERRLCETFQASRPTVRAALGSLAKDGWFEIRQGRRNRLRKPPGGRKRAAPKRNVGIIVHEPYSHFGPTVSQGISEMRVRLAEQGFSTELYICPAHGSRAQRRGLEAFVRQNRVSCCVLVSASRVVQRWFCDHGVPALVLGSCHSSVRLPSLAIDYRAVCRHAAGVFLSKGHREVALVLPDSGTAGDLASEESFREAMRQQGGHASMIRHNGTAQSITVRLDALFRSARPPTALLVARTETVFAVMMYLLNQGLAVPGSVSLIARDSDQMFEMVHPLVAHYSYRSDGYIRQLCRLMLQMLTDRPAPKAVMIVPKYYAGRTVKAR